MGLRLLNQVLLAVWFFCACVPQIAAASVSSREKAFAVFVISYDARGEVRGGVAGTAFFVSSTKALTAYHVLQEASFTPRPGHHRARVWLVHERTAPIEIRPTNVKFDPENDLTAVELEAPRAVDAKYVFERGGAVPFSKVETQGFLVNSAGPVLARVGAEIEILSVPRLERVHLTGEIVRQARVDLRAADVTLKATPCFQVSYEPVRGISGGPLLINGKVIGVNSFGDPDSRARTWAVAIQSF